MLRKIAEPTPPSGFKLRLARAPLYLYRVGLGWLLGDRFLRLKHTGRRSGKINETVLEVIRHDKSKARLFVASGYGEKSQWFQNIVANSSISIMVNRTENGASARVVSATEAAEILTQYAQAHPKSMKTVARFSGYEISGTEADIIEFSAIIKIIEFTFEKNA